MTLWIAYTGSGKELAAQEEAEALGLWAAVPRKVDMLRKGYNRRAEPVISAYLPNYAFIEMTAEEWHWLQGSKTVRTLMGVGTTETRAVLRFIELVEADFATRMAQIEAGQRVDEYVPGEEIKVLEGAFAETLLRFKRVAEGADGFPAIIASTVLFGREAEVRLDPLVVRKAG